VTPRIALVTYSTKPRGGVVHTLSLAEALFDLGVDVQVVTLGDPAVGFYRPTRVPTIVVPAPGKLPTLEERVFASIDALETGLRAVAGQFDVFHTQDCISARAAARVRDTGHRGVEVVRTVHHIDDFTTPALIDCQNQAVIEPDRILVVSSHWQRLLADEHGVAADVVPNGVDLDRFAPIPDMHRRELRTGIGVAEDQFLFLSVGGIEPRKGSVHLIRAMAALRSRLAPRPVLAVVGGHSFQDYEDYRNDCLTLAADLGLELGRDVVQLGTVSDADLPRWYRAADALAFPSTKEGWGLAVLEAQAADLPVVTSDLPVFHEYLTDGVDALMTRVGDSDALADGLLRVATSAAVRASLVSGGRAVAERFSWVASARRHQAIYEQSQIGAR
jgi:glycosyltransferase-like protein